MVKAKAAKNRVQPANSLQAKHFVSRYVTRGELVAVPHFSLLHDFCHGLIGPAITALRLLAVLNVLWGGETGDSFLFRAGCGRPRSLLAGTSRRVGRQSPSDSPFQVFDELLVAPGPAWHGGHSRGCATGCPTRREKITRNLLITSGLFRNLVCFVLFFVRRARCLSPGPSLLRIARCVKCPCGR